MMVGVLKSDAYQSTRFAEQFVKANYEPVNREE